MNTSAEGLRVLVTAGAAGIGRAIPTAFASAGGKVFVCDMRRRRRAGQPGRRCARRGTQHVVRKSDGAARRTVSLRRMVQAEDVANMALFLATRAGANISGQALSVCGDLTYLP